MRERKTIIILKNERILSKYHRTDGAASFQCINVDVECCDAGGVACFHVLHSIRTLLNVEHSTHTNVI